MLVTPSSITKVWARTQHAQSFGVMRTAVRLHLRNQKMYLPTVSFRVLLSYVLWAYFIITKCFSPWGCSEFNHKVGYVYLDTVIQGFNQKFNIFIVDVSKLSKIEHTYDDYLR